MYVGGYTLDLYCDETDPAKSDQPAHNGVPDQYFADSRAACLAAARQRGWIISKQHHLCPQCSGKPSSTAPTGLPEGTWTPGSRTERP